MRAPRGQSLVETLVGMTALGALFVLLPVVGRYQDLALQAGHAASAAAFSAARGAVAPGQRGAGPAFAGAGTRWVDRRGQAMLPGGALAAGLTQASDPDAGWQLGGAQASAAGLRRQWSLDEGIVTARVRVAPLAGTGVGAVTPALRRHAAVLAGGGHAGDDVAAQSRMSGSALAWSDDARRSVSAGRAAATSLRRLDAAWSRPAPDFDWLSAWAGLVPAEAVRAR